MSRFDKIVRLISDIDVKTATPQNAVFLVAILFIVFATGHYELKFNISVFLVIMGVLFVILAVLRHFYKIKTDFTILGQSVALFFFLISGIYQFHEYKVYKSFRKGFAYEKKLPDHLLYYNKRDELDSEVDFSEDKFTINFFEVFNDALKTRDVLCLIKQIDKKTKRETIMLASFEETLAMFGEARYKNTMLYDIWLKHAECLANNSNNKVYKTIIDKIKDFKKRIEKIAEKNKK